MDHAAPRGVQDRVGAAGGVELFEDRADVKLGRVDGYSKPLGDGLVGGAFGHQRQHIKLARRQLERVAPLRRARSDGHHRGLPGRGQRKTGNVAEQRCQAVCQLRVVDLDRDDDRLFAHVSGLSPIVTLSLSGSPPRRIATSTTDPTLSGPSARNSERTPDRASSFQPTMTSPCRTPAAADGPVLSTLITIAPTPLSSLIGCSPRPRYPRAMRPWISSLAATRAIVAAGMTSTRRGPRTAMPMASPDASRARPPW